MLGQTVRRRSTWATWASLSARGLARCAYRRGPSASTSRLTVRRLRPNSRARALSDHPWRRRTCNSIQVSPDCKGSLLQFAASDTTSLSGGTYLRLITTTGLRSCSETCALLVISPAHYSCAPTASAVHRRTVAWASMACLGG